jgi:acid phosphatase type 7
MRRIALLLTAAIGTVALLAFFYPGMMVKAADTTPPDTMITSGPGDTSDGTADFAFSSTESASTFKCKLVGQDLIRTKCTSPKTYPNRTAGTTYTFKVWATDAAGNIDPTPAKLTFTPSGGGGGTDCADLVGAGDISSGSSRDQETGNLIKAQLNCGAWGVFTTGDNAYPDGRYQDYQVYHAAWGSFKAKTRPAFGNHDYYGSLSADGANQYWNESPAVPVPGGFTNSNSYYYYDIPNTNWRGIVLNSASSEGPKDNQAPSCETDPVVSPQMVFLNNALNTTKHTVLFWHHARFSASTDHPTTQGATGCSKTFFDEAHDNGADLVVQGHSHVYERYDTRDIEGNKVTGGLTSIVCGLGGNSSDGLQGSPSPAYDKAFTNAWGVCTLTLNTNNAEVSFLRAPDSTVMDSATVAIRP